MKIKVKVNGKWTQRNVDENRLLLQFLREDLGLTGTKEGCGQGECGACTIIFNGMPVNSCLVFAVEADGADIRTIEGEAKNGAYSKIQQAFNDHHAVQCGFCTPGMIMSVRALLAKHPKPSDAVIKEALDGNFCRCTGYQQIIEAVQAVSGRKTKGGDLRYV